MSSVLQCQCKRCSRTYAIAKEYTFLIIPLVSVMIFCALMAFLPLFLSLPIIAVIAYFVYKDATRDVAAETEEELKKMSEITEKTAAEFEMELLAEESARMAKEQEKEKARKLKRQQLIKEENEQLRKAAAAAAASASSPTEGGKKKKKSTTSAAGEEDEDELFHAAQFALGAKKAAIVTKALNSSSGNANDSSGNAVARANNVGSAGAQTKTDELSPENGSSGSSAVAPEKQKKILVRDANGWETLVSVGSSSASASASGSGSGSDDSAIHTSE